ncbi:MAG: lytic transglycosylase domain-containing protein [Patescibacteria group bacterium]|jgi:membrane-bound lytic murein transglycosylase B
MAAETPEYIMTLLLKRVRDFVWRAKNGFISIWNNKKIIPLFPMVAITFSMFPVVPTNSIASVDPISSTIQLDLKSGSVLSVVKPSSIITPGESTVQRLEREQNEALARAKADAAAKAVASRNTVSRERRVYTDPTDFDTIYHRAEASIGVDWKLLKSIHIAETGASGSSGIANKSGATGPMQFLPSTFRRHAVDGNGDGILDITNVEDAIFSAAQYLKDCGYPNVKQALWGYNPSTSYFNKVTRIYNGL